MTTIGLDMPAFLAQAPARSYHALAQVAEQAGFDRLWVGDHLLWHRPRFETFSLLSLLAGSTTLGLGTAVALAPLRPPWWLAKQAASLHELAPGGLVLGLGTGGEYEREYATAGVPLSERGARLDESIRFCRRWWGGEEGADASPRPTTPIPIWVGGRRGPALARAAMLADGWLGLFLTPEAFARRRSELSARRPAGLSPLATSMALWCCADSDPDRARRTAQDLIAAEYQMDPSHFSRYIVAGTPDEVAHALKKYVDAGADHLDIHLAHPDVGDQLLLWGHQVIPQLRSEASQ